ncbi:MAG: hypothetical protein V1907_02715 [Candidatus Kerfeldbacteria bacterium]
MTGDFRNNNIDLLRKEIYRFTEAANSTFREVITQVIVVSTVFLTASAFLLQKNPSVSLKHSLIYDWIGFGISILCGIIQLFIEYNFINTWANAKIDTMDEFYNDESIQDLGSLKKIVDKHQGEDKVPRKSSTLFFIIQGISFFLSSIALGVIVFQIFK